ncbi:ribosomal RNA small subunit methyltransferase NEP1-like isoform X2 [Macadamia integrifolia]|uniref:ribosomal RNA small subunit methyltransferase NEP1-like isoform X2 n=1 Tax=Macadamia integrifolia TaxID=60698 RepID=UPI001C4EE743|nr:ribosomal RNA small subunit methyltransferase NEP1-like isoform X2 [Macadamia integrifolia]
MVRPYRVKGFKRKKIGEEVYDKEDKEEEEAEEKEEEEDDKEDTTAVEGEDEEDERRAGEAADELPGIPIVASNANSGAGVIFVLERASLEVAKVGKTYQLLNSDDHVNFLLKHGKKPADYRPDIAFQAILSILDSRLNKAGRLRALYVKTEKGVLFEIKPYARMPRTFKRFSGLILQLLQKLSVNASGKREKLLRVIKNPVTRYLPLNSRKIGLSHSAERMVRIHDYVNAANNDVNLVFVVGAMAHGKINTDYTDDFISVSGYPLSAAYCLGMICNALEQKWNIL